MKKIYIILPLILLFLAYPIAYINNSKSNVVNTTKVLVIKGTIKAPENPYSNDANEYAGMEHWLVPLAAYDANLNKIEDLLETKIHEANGKDVEVIVAAAHTDLESAMAVFQLSLIHI